MNKLPCEVVMDLIPLIKDHVASKESEELVRAHIRECDNCRQYYELLEDTSFDDQKVIETIRHKRNLYLTFILLAGVITGYHALLKLLHVYQCMDHACDWYIMPYDQTSKNLSSGIDLRSSFHCFIPIWHSVTIWH